MNTRYLIYAATVLVLCSCAAPQEQRMTEEYWTFSRPVLFTPENMLAKDYETKAKALLDYTALDEDSKEKVVTYLAYMMADEKDALVRHDLLDLLRDINAGPYVVAPLIKAYGRARYPAIRTEISQFINEYKPSTLNPAALIVLLEEKDWETRLKGIRVLASMKSKAGPAVPEIIKVMQETGPSYGLYGEIVDFAMKINREAMLAAVSLDLAGPKHEIRESALRKMYEVYIAEESQPQDRQAALKGIVRVMFNGDEELSLLSKKLLEKTGFEQAKAKAAEFDAYKNMKVESMKALTAGKLAKKFAEEEDDQYLTLKMYYIKNNRRDAVKSIFDPAKERAKP